MPTMNRRTNDKAMGTKQRNTAARISAPAKVFRVMTAVVVFGIPLITGAAALIGYGAHHVYTRISGKRR